MDGSQMTQSNLATVRQFEADHVVIGGRTLGFDEILNDAFFSPAKIAELGEAFANNRPFPHLVLDGLFSPALLEAMYEEFDLLKKDQLQVYNNMNEKKLATRPFARLGNAAELHFNTIHSSRFVDFLQQITGIRGLITDPGLDGGGLHSIPTGGKFALHVDFNQHATTKLENRLIFITYLNKDWLPSYGGALELWNIEEEKCEAGSSRSSAAPSFSTNRREVSTDIPNRSRRRTGARGALPARPITRMGETMAKTRAFTARSSTIRATRRGARKS
jgi:hypothetical protein